MISCNIQTISYTDCILTIQDSGGITINEFMLANLKMFQNDTMGTLYLNDGSTEITINLAQLPSINGGVFITLFDLFTYIETQRNLCQCGCGGGGGNIDSINGDVTAAQLLTPGTSGTDFAIVDDMIGGHVFDLPTASAVNRGALSSADWSTFNSKILTVLNSMTVGTIAASTTTYIMPGTNIASVTESQRTYYLNNACTAARYLVATSTAQSATGSLVITFRNSAAATSITVTIAAGSAAGRVTDYVNTASCLVDSGISHQVVNNATATSANINQISINLK